MKCACGCGRKVDYKQPRTGYLRNHQPSRINPLNERVTAKIRKVAHGCWEWTGSKNSQGYGNIKVGDRTLPAHRIVFEMYGNALEVGMDIDHLCRNKGCVNPKHLELVTRSENVRRGKSTKLNKTKVLQIRASKESSRKICKKFNVCAATIRHIRLGLIWKDICVQG